MAPDLNSIASPPVSSPPVARSRRTSQQMAPPNHPLSSPSLNILPSNQSAVNHISPLASPNLPTATLAHTSENVASQPGESAAAGGPGPLRHPRPLTHAELHLQLEKEQEAVVNRLTRELSMLRAAQNASVVSNASSTSTGLPDTTDNTTNHLISGPSHPAPSQRHNRTSSNASNRSTTNTVGSLSTVGGIAGSISSTGIAPERHRTSISNHPQSLSRQNSSSRRSGASSPAPSTHSSYQNPDLFPHFYQSRPSLSQYREPSAGNIHGEGHHHQHRSDSITSVQTSGRYDEVALHRSELETVKKENEALKRKIRELERTLRNRSQSDASRTRSESVSTTASASLSGVGRGRQRDNEEEDGVRVGESARSAGVGLGRP